MKQTLRVVILDDESLAICSVEECIRQVDPDVSIIGRYTDAAALLRDIGTLQPDAVFTDVCMGKFSGLELIEECTRAGLQCAFIIISAYAEFSYAQRAMHSGVLSYLVKPVDVRQMSDAISAIRRRMQPDGADSGCSESLCQSVGRYLREHCGESERVSLSEIARHFHVNASWLSERFSLEMGMSFSRYRTQVRIERARRLLEGSDESIASIAEVCGFQDASYFTSVFKQYAGCTPAQYRSQAQRQAL